MKKIIALLLALVMAIGMVACGAKEPAPTEAPVTEAPVTEAPTEAPTDAPTEEVVETEAPETEPIADPTGVEGVVEAYIPEIADYESYFGTLEIVDDETIVAHIYQQPMYKVADIENLVEGNTIKVDGRDITVNAVRIYQNEFDGIVLGKSAVINEGDEENLVSLAQKSIPDWETMTETWGDYYAHNNMGQMILEPTVDIEFKITDVEFYDTSAWTEGSELVAQDGAALMEKLKAEPDKFTLRATTLTVAEGTISVVQLLNMGE